MRGQPTGRCPPPRGRRSPNLSELIGFTGLFTPGEHRARDDGADRRCDRDGGEKAEEHQD